MTFDEPISLAALVFKWRNDHGYSISEASRVSGIPFATLRRIEHGSEPRSATIAKLSKVLLMPPNELYSRYLFKSEDEKKYQ
ncbi:helix-turn-helix domain protein [Weissella oryzae SG25]|uniref:Helix-turn-helix domain protein n=1 Tax=Weissella oryzae (strain DSM 25784 / JCM 18191 / LMG 30913 / SG25) TaxID=1329250 RepID=A0A069CSD8_WEIOS|nr:helix-turn-helix transcriptional regulator [Weissella oryzae]GAK30735.1 helix-turn-helix domain protein [Weissella oryzae SG25]